MKKILLAIVALCVFVGCNSRSDLEREIAAVEMDVEITRFDKIFGNATLSNLPRIKADYPMFFPEKFADSVWEQRLTDSLQRELTNEVARIFPYEEPLEDELRALFQHIKYYFDDFTTPKIYTTTSDVDYATKVIVADSLLLIELDTYLGSDHYFYNSISKYITKNMRPGMITSDVAMAYSKKYVQVPRERSLLAQMVYFGKELYLKDLWLPDTSDADKIGYTGAEWDWAIENEAYIWSYFIEKELLYSTDPKLAKRFVQPAPFSKFELLLDNESPGMIARFTGWQIVRSYMKNNDISISQLMNLDAVELYNNSKYKPKK